jgi:hypothetical protein
MQDAPLEIVHNMIMPFMLLLANSPLHGENATWHTGLLWPVNVDMQTAEPLGCTCQSLIKESKLHVAASDASGLKAIEVAGNVCPVWLKVQTASGRISRASSAAALRLLKTRADML